MASSSSGSGLRASGRRPASSSLSTFSPGGPVELGVRRPELADAVEQLADGLVVLLRVLADVEGRQGEPGGGDGADQALDLAAGHDRSLVREHRAVEQQQVVEQLGVVGVVAARRRAGRRRAMRCSVSPSRTWTQVRKSR